MKTPTFLAVLGLALLLSSCATPNFKREWDRAVAETKPPYTSIAGPWEGKWTSGHNQHTGELKCVVTETGQDHYRFLYFARWGSLMKGTFAILCTGEKKGNTVTVSGEKKLVPFGVYDHKGTLTPSSFKATFGSDGEDFGEFQLSRPAAE